MKKKILLSIGLYFAYLILTIIIFYFNGTCKWTSLPTNLVIKRIIFIPLFLQLITLINIWLFNKGIVSNKKKIIVAGLVLIIVFGFITGIIDYDRIKNGKMPIFVISEIEKKGPEIEYYGLNYKIVRRPTVSYKDDLKNDLYVKFGFWFHTWIIKRK